MTEPTPVPDTAKRLARRAFAPVFERIDALRAELQRSREAQQRQGAQLEQLARQVERLEAFQQVTRDQMAAELAGVTAELPGIAAGMTPAEALRTRLDEALLHAEVLAESARRDYAAEVAELRSLLRLTQAVAERARRDAAGAAAASGVTGDAVAGDGAGRPEGEGRAVSPSGAAVAPRATYTHDAPDFDLLYRAFEDRHRGSVEQIRERQREDYLELLSELPNADLPVIDLGCGRGELVQELTQAGQRAVGVDSNTSQVLELVGGDEAQRFVEDDLFRWLDAAGDGSCRAVVSMHVVEHLPTDLQVRLVFEAQRVLAPGGVLVLKTPNTLSLSTAATNFWVDPTHERPVHPLFLEFLAREAGFASAETRLLHPIEASLPRAEGAGELVDALDSLLLGHGDLALVAWR